MGLYNYIKKGGLVKNLKTFLAMLLTCSVLLHAEKPLPAGGVLADNKINNGTYTLDYKDITLLIPPYEIVVARLKTLRPPTHIIATFQVPDMLEIQDYPRFSPDGRYLLILNAPWSLLYQEHPTTYEWNLFDLTQQKTIKTFSWGSYPIFMKNKNAVLTSNGTEFTLP